MNRKQRSCTCNRRELPPVTSGVCDCSKADLLPEKFKCDETNKTK